MKFQGVNYIFSKQIYIYWNTTNCFRFNPHKEAQERYKQIQEDKKARRFEASKKKEEIRQALEEYKKKKNYRNKKLGKKTKKGQPVMKERLELLLEKIQANIGNGNV